MQNIDTALPATTTSKEIEDISTLTVVSEIGSTGDKSVSDNKLKHGGENTITEVVVVASVDTQMQELKGI